MKRWCATFNVGGSMPANDRPCSELSIPAASSSLDSGSPDREIDPTGGSDNGSGKSEPLAWL